jgi:hypothetical protein
VSESRPRGRGHVRDHDGGGGRGWDGRRINEGSDNGAPDQVKVLRFETTASRKLASFSGYRGGQQSKPGGGRRAGPERRHWKSNKEEGSTRTKTPVAQRATTGRNRVILRNFNVASII